MRWPPASLAARLTAAVALGAVAAVARAQGAGPAVGIRAAAHDTLRAEAGAAFTAVFTLTNRSDDSARAAGRLEVPRGWHSVAPGAAIVLAPHASDTWLAGVSVPASAAAGAYAVRAVVDGGARDSVVVRVEMRRGLEVVALDAPSWVITGEGYEARFLVRNTGNVRASVSLNASAGRATPPSVDQATLELAPASAAVVTVRAEMAPSAHRTADDVIQLVAVDRENPGSPARASARTTVVPRGVGGDYTTLPTVVAVRSTGASGVSPVVLGGSGTLADGRTRVDFLLQAPTDQRSPFGFGERDEYRAAIERGGTRLRAGDNVYGTSLLMSTGVMGTGAELSRASGTYEYGAYAQHYRWTPGTPNEAGAWFGVRPDSATRVTATTLVRQSRDGAVGVAGLAGGVRIPLGGRAELETAASDSAGAFGASWRARVRGDTLGVRYDASLLRGSDAFAGPVRGTTVAALGAGARVSRDLDVAASATRRDWSSSVSSLGRMGQAFSTATVTATWRGATSVEYGWLGRRDDAATQPVNGSQRGVRVSSAGQAGPVALSGSVEHGTAQRANDAPATPYTIVSAALRIGIGRLGAVGVSASRSVGQTLTGANGDLLGAGVNAQLRLPYGFEFGATMSAQRATFGVLDTSGAWFSVADARLERRFGGGATVGVHARALQNPAVFGAGDASAVYLEYRAPFRLPVGPSRERGRALGQVMDADRGTPVSGVLVRLGDEAAVSDRNGYVRFAGLGEREYRVSLEPAGVTAGAILVGDVSVDVRAAGTKPADFAVAVTRGAQVIAQVGREEPDGFGDGPGGPAPADRRWSPIGGVLVALEGVRDTLFEVTDDRGVVRFGIVAPGKWTLSVRTPTDDPYVRYDRERVPITVAAGERRTVTFTQAPAERQVRMMDGGGTLKARPRQDGTPPHPPRPRP